MKPTLSVVVVAFNTPSILAQCLTALTAQRVPGTIEILVIGRNVDGRDDEDNLNTLVQRFAEVRWIEAPADYTIPRMRSLGIRQSQGEVIALLEDDCLVDDDWCTSIIAAHQQAHVAIGGAIEPGPYQTGLDWGIYLCEYGRFMAPFIGPVAALPGNNVSYKRTALAQSKLDDGDDSTGFYEVFVHWQWQQAGGVLIADPGLTVCNINHWGLTGVTVVPFHHGRAFAGQRAANWPWWRRLPYACLTVLLPLLQTGRVVREVGRRRRKDVPLGQALPWIGLFTTSWAWGECLGYLWGSGDSIYRWR